MQGTRGRCRVHRFSPYSTQQVLSSIPKQSVGGIKGISAKRKASSTYATARSCREAQQTWRRRRVVDQAQQRPSASARARVSLHDGRGRKSWPTCSVRKEPSAVTAGPQRTSLVFPTRGRLNVSRRKLLHTYFELTNKRFQP